MTMELLTSARVAGDYRFDHFVPQSRPDDELLVQSIQRESYIASGLVDVAGSTIIRVDSMGDEVEVLHPSITSLTNTKGGYTVESVLGQEQDGTGRVAYKKYYADSMDTVPSYQFGKHSIWPEQEEKLRIAAATGVQFAELAAMSKTRDAKDGAIRELMKYEIRRRQRIARQLGRNELWLCAIARPAREAFCKMYGEAVKQIGDPMPPQHPLIRESLTMVAVDVMNFYENIKQSADMEDNPYSERQRQELEYMTS